MPLENPKRMLRRWDTLTAVGPSDELSVGPVPRGEQWYLECVCASNQTNAVTKIEYVILSSGREFVMHYNGATNAGVWRFRRLWQWLREGETIIARVTGATAGDLLILNVMGHYGEFEEGVLERG